MRLRIAWVVGLVLAGCPKEIPPPEPVRPPPGPTPEQMLRREVDALQAEALALVKEEDEALWAHWVRGAPLQLEKPAAAHAALFEDAALAKVRAAKRKPLETWLVGQRLARATADANAAVSELEAAQELTVDGKKVPWRDLSRLLANEKSAVKRKALWAASRDALTVLGDAYQKRDDAVAAALASMGTSGPGLAGIGGDEAAALGERLLDETEAEWKAIVAALAQSELGLTSVTRADLPRMLKPNTAADAAFPRAEQAAKATAVLSALGMYGLPGLTLDLAESAKKNPLPLTVAAGGAGDVRVSFRPAGGARDMGALLGELGRGLALRETPEPRLADQVLADATARVFAELAATPAWLESVKVPSAAAAATSRSARALRLYVLRRAAANLVAQQRGGEDPATVWNAWMSRALGIAVVAEDAPRWRLERDPLLHGVALLRAERLADAIRAALGPQWWEDAGSAPVLRAAWSGKPLPVRADGGWAEGDAGTAGDAGTSVDRTSPDAGR